MDLINDPELPWWQQLFVEADGHSPYSGGYFSVRSEFGQRPAVLVVDVIRSFTGDEGQSIEESTSEYPTSCGPIAWEAMPAIRRLVDLAVELGWPLVYTTGLPGSAVFGGTVKGERMHGETTTMDLPRALEIPSPIAPPLGALVLAKPKASAFFDTPLVSYLIQQRVDTVLVVGGSTSGCVRATVVDAYSHGFATFVVEDGCFDRSRLSHGVNLAEMHRKYADVLTFQQLESLAAGGQVGRGTDLPG